MRWCGAAWQRGWTSQAVQPVLNRLDSRLTLVQLDTMSDEPTTANDRLYDLPEAARLTGLTVDALRKRASRGKLEQIKGNDGTVRVRLTTADLEAVHQELSGQRRSEEDQAGQVVQTVQTLPEVAGLREALATEREAVARERQRAERAEAQEAIARTRSDQAEREREEARVRAAGAEGEVKVLREVLTEARATIAEARKPIWQRWFGL